MTYQTKVARPDEEKGKTPHKEPPPKTPPPRTPAPQPQKPKR